VDLFESLWAGLRRHSLVFIGFTGEEEGLVGSRFYVIALTAEQKTRTAALVNVECLGLSPTAMWLSHADPQIGKVSRADRNRLNLHIGARNVEQVGRGTQ